MAGHPAEASVSHWDPPTVRAMTAGIARGDDDAFNRFYDRYYDRLSRYAFVMARGSGETARDVVQETMLRVVRYLKPFDSEEVLWGWLTRVARTAYVDQLRREGKHGHRALPANVAGEGLPDDATAYLVERLGEVVRDLPVEDASLIRMRYADGRSLAEIAAVLGITSKAAESRLARLRGTIRARLEAGLKHEQR